MIITLNPLFFAIFAGNPCGRAKFEDTSQKGQLLPQDEFDAWQ
jgi:hypothetical protein